MFARRLFSSSALRVPDRVSVEWLRANLSAVGVVDGNLAPVAQVKVVDGTWLMPPEHGIDKHKHARVAGSVFFDVDACTGDGGAHDLPHMLPTASAFAAYAGGKLGCAHWS